MKIGSLTFQLPPRSRETYLFCISLAVLFVTASEIIDFFEFPFESLGARLLTSGSLVSAGLVTSLLTATGYFGIFTLMALESASLPIPSELVLPFSGYLVFKGALNFAGVVTISTGAGLVGALVDYYLALKLGRPFLRRLFKLFNVDTQTLNRAEAWVRGKGSWSVLAARFVPGVRTIVSLPAGALRMRLRPFVLMTIVGTAGWSLILVYVGYSAGSLWQASLAQSLPLLTNILLSAGLVASLSYILYYLVRRFGPVLIDKTPRSTLHLQVHEARIPSTHYQHPPKDELADFDSFVRELAIAETLDDNQRYRERASDLGES